MRISHPRTIKRYSNASYRDVRLLNIPWNVEHFMSPSLMNGQRERKIHERVERN